jgi:D-ribose pyranose/furanose isomerase RbsD
MQQMRESWTDERLDDLNGRIGEGFSRIDADLGAQRAESIALRKEMKDESIVLRREMREDSIALRREMKASFDALGSEMNARFDAMHQTMIRSAGIVIAALIGVLATQL